MTQRVSTGTKKQGQKYQNTTAYRHNKSSRKTRQILALPIQGLCEKCFEIIDWRKRFRKYKPLTTPKKCVGCNLKAVKDAYHVMCDKCAADRGVCAKCLEKREILPGINNVDASKVNAQQQEFEVKLKLLSERQRRTFLRKLERGDVTENDLLEMDIKTKEDAFWDDFSDEDDDDDEVDQSETGSDSNSDKE